MKIKAYKGFDKNMQCRGFQFEEGKEYEENEASLCKKGFHACENPLDTFKYYEPGKGSAYHDVELDATEETGKDSKRCGTRIKIGAKLSVLDICKAHFQYVKERTTNKKQGKDDASLAAQYSSSLAAHDSSSLAAGNRSSLAAHDSSSLAAGNRSSLAAQDSSSLAAGNRSSLAAQDWSSLAAQNSSSLAAGNRSSLAAQYSSSLAAHDSSSLAAQYSSSLAAQDWSSLAAQNSSSLAAHDSSSLAAQDSSSLAAHDSSSLAAQDSSSLAAGKNSVIAAFNSKAKGDLGTLIVLATREFNGTEGVITGFSAGIVDGEKIKANTWYEVKNGEFVEVKE